jgi:predicted DNA-binding WGR domain protein
LRRLEYVGGSSEKFWEASRDDVAVTVRWGRIGTAGQSKRTEFGDATAAEAFLAKQAAEKLRKGYTEVGAGATAAPPAHTTPGAATPPAPAAAKAPEAPPVPDTAPVDGGWPDEDTFAPAALVRAAYPRRDQGRPKRRTDPAVTATAVALQDEHGKGVAHILAHPESERDLVGAAERYLDGEPDALGAAVVAVLAGHTVSYHYRGDLTKIAQGWVQRHGPVFAAAAAVLLTAVGLGSKGTGRGTSLFVRRTGPDDDLPWQWAGREMLGEVRTGLAAASDEEYAAAVARLESLRTTDFARLVAAFLAPTEDAWVAELLDGRGWTWSFRESHLLMAAVGTPEQLRAVADRSGRRSVERDGRVLPTLLRTIGPPVARTFAEWLENADTELTRRLLAALVEIPTDEAFTQMLVRVDAKHVRPAVQEAMRRYPKRATRLLAATVTAGKPWSATATELLRTHLIALPALLEDVVPALPPADREAAGSLVAGLERLPDAPAELLPAVLADPPWDRPKPAATTVVADLPVTDTPRVAWEDGEEAAWFAVRDRFRYYNHNRGGGLDYPAFLHAPMEEVAPHVTGFRPRYSYGIESWGRPFLARFGLDAVPTLVHGGIRPQQASVLLPVLDERVARYMAEALARSQSARTQARTWLARHGLAALPFLLPTALGPVGRDRDAAAQAVRVLAADRGGEEVVAAAAAALGEGPAAAVRELLATDPLTLLPRKLPVPGAWADAAALPQIRLRGERYALPVTATRDLITMLALSKPGEPYGGVEQVAAVCDPASLAAFGWALFEQWRGAGMPPKDGWALTTLGVLGDDETVRRLSPVIRNWPGEGGHARAVAGLDVLADIGSDIALMHLNGIAQKVKFAGLRERAREKIALVAEKLDLTTEQLADRLVPDLGLSEDGSMLLDYGPRRFVVGFDEQLKPTVSDEDGTRRKALPKPGAKDDKELADAAYQRFAGLKKDVRTLAGDQLTRLERAMVTGRRWSRAEFGEFLAGHPLLAHLVRRLVWGAYDADGALVGSFRLAEDRSLADVDDETYAVPDGATVGVAHPLHLGDAVAAWSEIFADYEILQPFRQLGRPVHAFTDEERAGTHLTRFQDITLPVTEVLTLLRRGWERSGAEDAGVEPGMYKPLPNELFAVVELDPGLVVGDLDALGDQTLRRIFVDRTGGGYHFHSEGTLTLGSIDAVSASELIADLTDLTEGARP